MQNPEYKTRKLKALNVNNSIWHLAKGIMIVGSVAYNPDAVTKKSDLDLVGVFDFSSLDFKELYKRLGQEYEPLIADYASKSKFNTFSILINDKFETGLHLWDKTAFENVINLDKHNLIFARSSWINNEKFISTFSEEKYWNLTGEEKIVKKAFKDLEGGRILRFYPYYQNKKGFYPGIQATNLLLDPFILSQKDDYLIKGINELHNNLKRRLISIYCKNYDNSVSLYNSLSPKMKEKITPDLKKRLDSFF